MDLSRKGPDRPAAAMLGPYRAKLAQSLVATLRKLREEELAKARATYSTFLAICSATKPCLASRSRTPVADPRFALSTASRLTCSPR
jgi:hypothetical protein